jgi:hypothetical protein
MPHGSLNKQGITKMIDYKKPPKPKTDWAEIVIGSVCFIGVLLMACAIIFLLAV